MTFMSPPDPGSAAEVPALLGWSSQVVWPTRLASIRPRTPFIIFHRGGRDVSVAYAARMKNMVHELRPAQQSLLTPPTDRDRRAFSHGSVRFGCTASLSPACLTAMRPMRSVDASTAALAAGGLRVTCPAYWSRISTGYGRDSAALVHRSACGGCAASVRGHLLPPVTAPEQRQGALTSGAADPEYGR